MTISNRLDVEEKNGRYMATIGCEDHGKPSLRVWINRNIPIKEHDGEKYVWLRNTKIVPTKSGAPRAKNLIPAEGWNTIIYTCEAGYRGTAGFGVYRNENDNSPIDSINIYNSDRDIIETSDLVIAPFYEYASERGSLGINTGAIISTTHPHLLIEWDRDGRLYGDPASGVDVIDVLNAKCDTYPDARVADIEDIEY